VTSTPKKLRPEDFVFEGAYKRRDCCVESVSPGQVPAAAAYCDRPDSELSKGNTCWKTRCGSFDVLGDSVVALCSSQHATTADCDGERFDSIFAHEPDHAAINAKAKNYKVRLGGVIATALKETDQIDKVQRTHRCGTMAHSRPRCQSGNQRLKKCTFLKWKIHPGSGNPCQAGIPGLPRRCLSDCGGRFGGRFRSKDRRHL